jgi:hypothetical protein
MWIKGFIRMIGKIQSNRKMIVTILAISIIFGSSISQFDGFAAAKDDESLIERVNFESCCCCATNIFKAESDEKILRDLKDQVKAKALEDGKIVCIYEKLKSKTRICCSNGKTVEWCEAISGDGEELDSTIENKGPIPTGKWLIGKKRNNGTWYNLFKLKKAENDEDYWEYDVKIEGYNRNQIGLHLGTYSKGCITVKDKACWEKLSNLISERNFLVNNTKFYGYLYVQYFYEEVEPKFENTKISNSIVDLVVTRDDLSDITSSPPSLFKREYTPADLVKIGDSNNGGSTGTGDHKPYRWRYRVTKKGEHKIKDFILDNVPDNPLNTANWGNWVAPKGWRLKIEKNKNKTWKITWDTDTPVDAVMVGFDHKFALDPKHPKGKCAVSFEDIPNEGGIITVPLDEPPTIEKQPLTGVYSTYNLFPDNVIELNVRVVGDFYSDKIYDIEIFPESQNPPWYGIDAIEAPEGWSYEKIGNGIRFYTLTDPLIKCQPRKFIFRVWGIRISRYIEIHITDKDHENLGVILSTWWQLKKVYRH